MRNWLDITYERSILRESSDTMQRIIIKAGEERQRRGVSHFVAISFTMSLVLSIFLFSYLAYRLACHSAEAWADPDFHWLVAAVPMALCLITVVGGVRWTVLLSLSFVSFQRASRLGEVEAERWPCVSIFVPAYNEAENIEAALEPLCKLEYPSYEVIVVDDGSTDDTFDRAKRFAGRHDRCTVRVYRKRNGGKWSAHNFAFRRSSSELVLCLDADSRIDSCVLKLMVRHMADPRVAAVAGQIRVRNRSSLLTRLQAAEYLMGNGCARMAMSINGTVLIVAGPLGLFRRCVLEEIYLRYGRTDRFLAEGEVEGPFEGDTFAEDFDLSMAILSLGGRIVYEPSAVSHTRAPDWPFAFISQRYRWYRGTIQVLRKFVRRLRSRPEIGNPRLLGWLLATYLFDLIVLPLVYLGALIMLFLLTMSETAGISLLGAAALALLANLYAGTMFAFAQRDSLMLLPILILYDVYQNFLIGPAWFISILDELRGARMRW